MTYVEEDFTSRRGMRGERDERALREPSVMFLQSHLGLESEPTGAQHYARC